MSAQIELVKKYVTLVENFELNEVNSTEIIHKDYLQWELPNLLNKNGQKSDVAESLRRIKVGKAIVSSQNYEITKTLEQGNTVVIESLWTGTMAVDAGPLKKGQQMKAFICMFFEFKDQKIYQVRNYDCF